MNTIRDASQQILAAIEARRRRESPRRRIAGPRHTVDALIAELEELNLAGPQRVPESVEPRLRALAAALPARFGAELRSRVAITRLMDHLYLIEEHLLTLRAGRRADDEPGATAPVTHPGYPQAG